MSYIKSTLSIFLNKIKQHKLISTIIFLAIVVILILCYYRFVLGRPSLLDSGFTQYTIEKINPKTNEITDKEIHYRTWWDFFELLIIPFVLAIGAFLLNKSERNNERKIAHARNESEQNLAKERYENDQRLAKECYENDQSLALDRQRETAFQSFIDRMTELLLEKKLRDSSPLDEIRTVASTITLSTILNLNPRRNDLLFRFLSESKLIEKEQPIVRLDHADLSRADLSNVNLGKVNLSETILESVQFISADLSSSDLSRANLKGADLSDAFVMNSNLQEATLEKAIAVGTKFNNSNMSNSFLKGIRAFSADFSGADLQKAKLFFADLRQANCWGTNFFQANLSESDLSESQMNGSNFKEANLSKAKLTGAFLGGSNLESANLSGADFSNTDLRGIDFSFTDLSDTIFFNAFITFEQLAQSKSLNGAMLPDGTVFYGDPKDLLSKRPPTSPT